MSTFRQLALRVIAESGLESEPVDSVLSPEYVFNWLKARYQKAIDAMPFGNVLAEKPWQFVTLPPKAEGTVSVTLGSNQVIGAGTSFQTFTLSDGWLFRTAGQNIWYEVIAKQGQVLTLDTVYANETISGVAYYLLPSIYVIDQIRWITSLVLPSFGELEEVHFSKMTDLDPYRSLTPAQPRMWIKRSHAPTGKRLVELYPYADDIYRIDVYGYGQVDEPLLSNSPKREIDEEMIVTGGLTDAFGYRSSLAAGRNENEKALSFMKLASIKKGEFDAYVKQISNRDSHDMAMPRIRVRMTHSQYLLNSPNETIMDAWDHVWSK